MSEPQCAPLEEWMESIIDYRGKTPEKTTAGIPLITAKVIKGGRIETPSEFIAADAYEEWMRRGIPEAGDVVITTEAPLGEVAQLPKGKVALAQRVITLSGKKGLVDNTFLKYLLLSRPFQEDLEARATGTTVVGIKQSVLRKINLAFPPFLDQKAISHILGTLDDKIELNRKTNETLEAMAKALFKSWFVDFDPVKAKAEGRPTGLPDDISDLFPDSFEDSELGETPRGWEGGTFGSFTTAKRGKIITRKDTIEGSIPVVAGGMEPAYYHNQSNVDAPVVTISASGANAGFVNLYFQPVWASDCSYISQNESKFPLTCYLFLKLSQQRIYDAQHGGVQPHINPGDLARLDFINATEKIFETFEGIVGSVFDKVASAIEQSKHLETLRDALLPKLISGEIRIPDAERMLEEVGV